MLKAYFACKCASTTQDTLDKELQAPGRDRGIPGDADRQMGVVVGARYVRRCQARRLPGLTISTAAEPARAGLVYCARLDQVAAWSRCHDHCVPARHDGGRTALTSRPPLFLSVYSLAPLLAALRRHALCHGSRLLAGAWLCDRARQQTGACMLQASKGTCRKHEIGVEAADGRVQELIRKDFGCAPGVLRYCCSGLAWWTRILSERAPLLCDAASRIIAQLLRTPTRHLDELIASPSSRATQTTSGSG